MSEIGGTIVENEVLTRTCRSWIDERGIIHSVAFPGSEETFEDAKENVAVTARLAGASKRPMLVDLRQAKSMSREVRQYYAGAETQRVLVATALLIGSPLSRAIGNFFMGLNKPIVPTRLFNDEAAAIAWLSTFRAA